MQSSRRRTIFDVDLFFPRGNDVFDDVQIMLCRSKVVLPLVSVTAGPTIVTAVTAVVTVVIHSAPRGLLGPRWGQANLFSTEKLFVWKKT